MDNEKPKDKVPELKEIKIKANDPELWEIIKKAKNTRIIIEDVRWYDENGDLSY